MPTNETTCLEPCPSALLVAFVTKWGTVKNHNPEDIEIDPCRVASVEIVPVEVCVNYDPITGENDYSALYIRFSWSGIWLKLDGICSNNNQCGYPIIYERTFTANYYLDEQDMGDGEIWYDEWYDFCGELKVFMMLPRSHPYTFCDIELAKLFYPLYSPTNIFPNLETGYPAIFNCTYYPPSPSASAMAAVDYYWMPTYQWQLVPACKLEVYYETAHVIAGQHASHSTQTDPPSATYTYDYYMAFWNDISYELPYGGGLSDAGFTEFQSKTTNTLLYQSIMQYRGAYGSSIIGTTPLCAEINSIRDAWAERLNEYIDEKLYGDEVEYIEDEIATIHYLGWHPDPWGRYRTNCTGFNAGSEYMGGASSWNSARASKTRCRIKFTKPPDLNIYASGVVIHVKVTVKYNDYGEYGEAYLLNTSAEPEVTIDEEMTVAFGDELTFEAPKNIAEIKFAPHADCPPEDAISQMVYTSLDMSCGMITCSQTIEITLLRYDCAT